MFTLHDAFTRCTVDQLKLLIDLLPGVSRAGRKSELIARMLAQYQGEELRHLWERLNELQQAAVAEALHGDGCFYPARFKARYGKCAAVSERSDCNYRQRPTLLAWFLHNHNDGYILPVELHEPLRTFVPMPEPVPLSLTDTLPDSLEGAPVMVRAMEREALVDLPLMLRLVEQGKLRVGEKTKLPGKATLALLTEQLSGGDFYIAGSRTDCCDQEIGAIKAFAWPLLLQAGGLASSSKGRLELSRSGIKALSMAPAEILKRLWQKWLGSSLLDEFSRVDIVKGQKAKGRGMTALGPRRAVIGEVLGHCSVGEWIEVDELGRYMRAEDLDFEVSHDPWKLYIHDAHYGALGYDGYHDWDILQLRYLLAFLFEYAAPLGMIDVAYVAPEEGHGGFGHMWGCDDLDFLSRYDGLSYIRLTELGAWCLGLCDEYLPRRSPGTVKLDILPSLQLRVVGEAPSAAEALLLDDWTAPVTEGCRRLDRVKALSAVSKGYDIGVLESFLQGASDQPLPEPVEAFFNSVRQQGTALKTTATALLVECRSAEIARCIASHRETAKLCMPAGERHLAVSVEHADKFRQAVQVVGFGWAL